MSPHPPKSYSSTMIVNELATRSGVPAHVVRYYARIGLLTPKRDAHNGYKHFTAKDVSRLRFIRLAKSLGFTLSEIREILRAANRGDSPCRRVRGIISDRIVQHRKELEHVRALQDHMEKACTQWRAMPDRVPDGNSIWHLIESTEEF